MTLQTLGICNDNPETTILRHLPSATYGMRYKSDGFCCSSCHDVIDGRASYNWRAGEK
ncbi:nuclease domain-containing protein [Pectobacterium brasiliense]|uniref:nuclease domain-containing protein n=1 Tax=Pectobacterium brasiliense TaxID=180957 RepID=UPI0030C7B92F